MTSYGVGELAPLNLSISRANQHVMRINLRRMELSAFIELMSTMSDQKADPSRIRAPPRKRQCRPRSRFLMVSRW
jgi:hypothetical protein